MTRGETVAGPPDWVEWVADRKYRGNKRFNVNRLCAHFGYEVDD